MTHLSIPHRRSPRLRLALAALFAFAAMLAVLALRDGGQTAPRSAAPALLSGLARPGASTDADIERLQAAVRAGEPLEAQLAAAYLQKGRETGDPGFYARADGVLRRALARGPDDPAELIAAATLAAGRHDFRGALRLAERARALQPEAVAPYPVLVDALVELGRYGRAERTLQRLVDLKPSLPAYARVSYFRELYGDLDGAAEAMARAASAGGGARENLAYVQTLRGDLERARGRLGAARRAYRTALASVPGYVPALAGRARLAAARGDLDGAIAGWRRIVTRLPLPEYAIELGETELAAGRRAAGLRDLELVGAQQVLLEGAGVNTDVELASFEADHGSPARALGLARRAWTAAPSVRSADAVGWALTRGGRAAAGYRWARRALRLGSVDPIFRYHAGMAALAAGRRAEGRRHLRVALGHGLAAHPFHADRARQALKES
jgi:tetratricopeptide (TPR) repeat protein